jgi:hypothetical protein
MHRGTREDLYENLQQRSGAGFERFDNGGEDSGWVCRRDLQK